MLKGMFSLQELKDNTSIMTRVGGCHAPTTLDGGGFSKGWKDGIWLEKVVEMNIKYWINFQHWVNFLLNPAPVVRLAFPRVPKSIYSLQIIKNLNFL